MIEQMGSPIGSTSVARWWLFTLVPGLVVSVVLVMLIRGYFETEAAAPQVPELPDGTESFSELPRNHVPGPVTYDQVPPVGGDHAPIWATCGVYATPVASELAVHAMEHGTVWVTYDAEQLSGDELADLERLVQAAYNGAERYVILSPFDGLPAPVVASAWGQQLRIDVPSDPRLEPFIRELAGSSNAPEPGLPCFSGGLGKPTDFGL